VLAVYGVDRRDRRWGGPLARVSVDRAGRTVLR